MTVRTTVHTMTERHNVPGGSHKLTKREFADVLRVSTRTVDRYISAGTIAIEKVGPSGLVRIHPDELDKVRVLPTATASDGEQSA